jgi:hypothetical protein
MDQATGSGNQRVLKLMDGKLEEDITEKIGEIPECEIIINPDGTIVSTVFFNIFK